MLILYVVVMMEWAGHYFMHPRCFNALYEALNSLE